MVISPPFEWQKRFNESDVTVQSRMDRPVEAKDMTPEEFDDYGAARRTLRQFCRAVNDLAALVLEQMIPDPGK